MTTDTKPTLRQAVAELVDLAVATRPDLDRDRIHRAIIGALAAWSWPRTLTAVIRMLTSGEEPRDLLNAVEGNPEGRYIRGGFRG